MRTRKFASEIYWPLIAPSYLELGGAHYKFFLYSFTGSFIGGLFTSLTGGNTNQPTKPTISTPSKSNHGFVQRNPEEQFLQDIAQDRFLQPPLNPEYAAKLRLLSTLPLNQRLAYIKAGLLRTGSRPLQQLGNLFTQNANQYRNQANELYPSRPKAPPASPRPGMY